MVFCFIHDVRTQGAEQIQNVQELALTGLFSIVPQLFQRLDASFDDKLHHAPIVDDTEPLFKCGKLRLDTEDCF